MIARAAAALDVPASALRHVVAAGVVLGVVYSLSPLAAWFAASMVVLFVHAGRGLPSNERKWVWIALGVAVAARVIAMAGLFVISNHSQMPFGSFFGDEEYFVRRSIWLRNIALDIPIHRADMVYAFDDYSQTSFLFVLALLHVLAGPSPYGVHFFNMALYLIATVMLYRLARPAFGAVQAFGGLLLLLFLPSLFAWSISALKEPLYFLLSSLALWSAVTLARTAPWWRRLASMVVIVLASLALDTIRQPGLAMSVTAIVGGLALAWLVRRPRLLVATSLMAAVLVGAALARPAGQLRAIKGVRTVARLHFGHITTPGWSYKLLDERIYQDRSVVDDMKLDDVLRFLTRAVVSYVVVPAPWNVQSRPGLAYLPEQIVWYFLVLMMPAGLIIGLKRDPLFTCLLGTHALIAMTMVALTSGNVGTLIRHRGLALPYMVWLSSAGACWLLSRQSSGSLSYLWRSEAPGSAVSG